MPFPFTREQLFLWHIDTACPIFQSFVHREFANHFHTNNKRIIYRNKKYFVSLLDCRRQVTFVSSVWSERRHSNKTKNPNYRETVIPTAHKNGFCVLIIYVVQPQKTFRVRTYGVSVRFQGMILNIRLLLATGHPSVPPTCRTRTGLMSLSSQTVVLHYPYGSHNRCWQHWINNIRDYYGVLI